MAPPMQLQPELVSPGIVNLTRPQSLPKSQEEEQKEQAQITFNKTLNGHYRHGKPGYERVGALFLTWEEDDMQCKETEVDSLRDLLGKELQYETDYYQIPSNRWETGLFSKVAGFLHKYDDQQCLAVIYYGGHGYNGTDTGNFKWAAKSDVGSDRDPAVFFNDFWNCTRWPACDQLLIIDCCYAARAFVREPTGKQKFEIISSAAEKDVVPSPRQPGSFTTCFTATLRKLIQGNPKGFCTSQLYRELYHHEGIARRPWLFDSARQDHGKIWLRPQRPISVQSPQEKLGETCLSLTLRLENTTDTPTILNQIALKLQYLPHVDQVRFENLYAPNREIQKLRGFLNQASKLRPLIRKLHARRRMKRIKEMLTEEDSKTFRRNFAKLLLELGDTHPAYDWSSITDHTDHNGAISKSSFRFRSKSPTWPFLPRPQSSNITRPSKRGRLDI